MISNEIANFLIANGFDTKIKHEIIFELLKSANREFEFIDIFTYEYVLEAFTAKRPFFEVHEQMEITLKSLKIVEDKSKFINFHCAIATIYQFKQSLEWHELEYKSATSIPFALKSERYTISKEQINETTISDFLHDVELLAYVGEDNRAKEIIERCLADILPEEIYDILKVLGSEDSRIKTIASDIGIYFRRYGILPMANELKNEQDQKAKSIFCEGWLKESVKFHSQDGVDRTLEGLYCFSLQDFNAFYKHTLENWAFSEIKYLFYKIDTNDNSDILSMENKIKTASIAIKYQDTNFISGLLEKIQNDRFKLIDKIKYYGMKYEYNKFGIKLNCIVDISNILLSVGEMKFNTVMNDAIMVVDEKIDSPQYKCATRILYISNYIARLRSKNYQYCKNDNKLFKTNISLLLKQNHWRYLYEINALNYRKELISDIIRLSDSLPKDLQEILLDEVINKAKQSDECELFECYWDYLIDKNKSQIVESFLDIWINPTSELWSMDLGQRNDIIRILSKICNKMNWNDKIQAIQQISESVLITYVDRKDYSLSLAWELYERIAQSYPSNWSNLGMKLLNVSEYASKIGDNRYYIQIKGSVAASVGSDSIESVANFIDISDSLQEDWFQSIFDAVISALQFQSATEEELLRIWDVASEIFYVYEEDKYKRENLNNKIYISDIHEAIKLCSIRLGYTDIENRMLEMSPDEFQQKRLSREEHNRNIPDRWYDNSYFPEVEKFIIKIKDMSFQEQFEYIESNFISDNDVSWRCVAYFVEQIKNKSISYLYKIKPAILNMLSSRPIDYPLYYDGSQMLYDQIFEYFTDKEVDDLIDRIIETYSIKASISIDSGEFVLLSDMQNLVFSILSKRKVEDNIKALSQIVDMHYKWILGPNYDESNIYKYYMLPKNQTQESTWSDVCAKIHTMYKL